MDNYLPEQITGTYLSSSTGAICDSLIQWLVFFKPMFDGLSDAVSGFILPSDSSPQSQKVPNPILGDLRYQGITLCQPHWF